MVQEWYEEVCCDDWGDVVDEQEDLFRVFSEEGDEVVVLSVSALGWMGSDVRRTLELGPDSGAILAGPTASYVRMWWRE